MAKISSISGFPEWLPAERIVERYIIEHLRRTFELHGFAEIETRAVEPVTELLSKGETSKEIYLLRRLQSDSQSTDADKDKELGLHFDITVPLARYVKENAGKLNFPFKRYQIQKVWRGERPQDGRFREFIQADIDVVAEGELPFHYEIEIPLIMAQCLQGLPIPKATVLVNNRKISQGFYEGIGITDVESVIRIVDKLEKIGQEGVAKALVDSEVATSSQAEKILGLASINGGLEVVDAVLDLEVRTDLLCQGIEEIRLLLQTAQTLLPGAVKADMKIARGIDYYTSMVYETVLEGHENIGSICSGGRYDKLVQDGKRVYPGVGISIGVSRLVARVISANLMKATRSVPTCVLVCVNDESERLISDKVAHELRMRGISAETAPSAQKLGKQIKYADKRGIPYVWFVGMLQADGTRDVDQVKDIRSGEQQEATANTWMPPLVDLNPQVVAS